jgi:hypothetical protein
MAIYYYVDLDCPVRRALEARPLVEHVRKLRLIENVSRQFREQFGEDFPEEKMIFKQRIVLPEGEEQEQQFTVAELQEQTEVLREYAPVCTDCPASITGHPFSCIQWITLPFSKQGEEWLVDQLGGPDALTGQLFRESVERMQYGECEQLDRWREAGFIESSDPVVRHSEGDVSSVTGNQILHMLLMVGDLSPAHCLSSLLVTNALGTTDGGDTDTALRMIERVQRTQSTEGEPGLAFTLQPEPADDLSVFEFKIFLMAAYRAFSLETPIAIRM